MRRGVVIGDCDEVQTASRRGFEREKHRTRDLLSRLALAMSIAMRGVHVQVAAVPSGTWAQRCTGEGICCRAVERLEEDFCFVRSCALWPDIRNADQQLPFTGNQFAG